MKKLSDVYVIRGTIKFPEVGDDPINTLTIDTGLDALRREVLAVWEVDFQPVDPRTVNNEITGTTWDTSKFQRLSCSVMKGSSVPTSQATLRDSNYVTGWNSDAFYKMTYITIPAAGGTQILSCELVGMENHSDYNSAEMPSRDALPIGYIVQGEFYLCSEFQAYDDTNEAWYTNCDVRIYAQRFQADVALYAALIAGQL